MPPHIDLPTLHKYLTRTLADFDDFMTKHQIEYSIAYGTLLGAVRHQDFIPWDDDIDIWMTRANYEKLIQTEKELPAFFWLQRQENDPDYHLPFAKLRDNRLRVLEGNNNDLGHSNGAFIDIFVIDHINDKIYNDIKPLFPLFEKVEKIQNRRNNIHNSPLVRLFLKLQLNILRKKRRYLFNKFYKTDTRSPSFVVCKEYLPSNCWKVHDFFPIKKSYKFGPLTLPGPNNFDSVLNGCGYGNYMQLPPKEQRKKHLLEVEIIEPID